MGLGSVGPGLLYRNAMRRRGGGPGGAEPPRGLGRARPNVGQGGAPAGGSGGAEPPPRELGSAWAYDAFTGKPCYTYGCAIFGRDLGCGRAAGAFGPQADVPPDSSTPYPPFSTVRIFMAERGNPGQHPTPKP